jgi:hypothetical protein
MVEHVDESCDDMSTARRNTEDIPLGTSIEGDTNPDCIAPAVEEYIDDLATFAFCDGLDRTRRIPQEIRSQLPQLQEIFNERMQHAAGMVTEIIRQINVQAELRRTKEFKALVDRDMSFWLPAELADEPKESKEIPLFGVITCVDKGVPYEAVIGVEGAIGRTLGGGVTFDYIESRDQFVMRQSALRKRFIHKGRSGYKLQVEPIIVHTSCGRQNQIISNEHGDPSIPSIGFVFKNIHAIASDFPGKRKTVLDQLDQIRALWDSYPHAEQAVTTPDQGLYADVVVKIAQRFAVTHIKQAQIVSPVEMYDKKHGDLIVGLDHPDVLTDEVVLEEKGYTEKALASLQESGKIFSIRMYEDQIDNALQIMPDIQAKGARTYEEMQENQFMVQTELVDITEAFWNLHESQGEEGRAIRAMVQDYLGKALYYLEGREELPEDIIDLTQRRLTHHLFHVIAYSYLLDTLNKGNTPGVHHIENYQVTGDLDRGTKPFVGLGQGDLGRPKAPDIFTGYNVLMHSAPGREGHPVPLLIKVDTDRQGIENITTEEYSIAEADFHEFLKLWPYFLCGDLIPVMAIRGKKHGGISRLGLSVLLTFESLVVQLESSEDPLPAFVPAATKGGKVVLVPAYAILKAGIDAGHDLGAFRNGVAAVAQQYDDEDLQEALRLRLAVH